MFMYRLCHAIRARATVEQNECGYENQAKGEAGGLPEHRP
jgi:hypothetical protein